MLAQVTPLERRWERRLRAEGLPAEIRPLTRRHPHRDARGSVVSLAVIREVAAASLGDAPVARYWALFAQAAHDLPENWGRRKTWLIAYADTGMVLPLTNGRNSRTNAYRWLKQFAAWRTVNGC